VINKLFGRGDKDLAAKYPFLRSWTGNTGVSEAGGLKVTGEINKILRGETAIRSEIHRRQAATTFNRLLEEMEALSEKNRTKATLYRRLYLNESTIKSITNLKTYTTRCFEAFSLLKQAPVPQSNTLLVLVGESPAVNLSRFNRQQQEYLVPPGTIFDVTRVEETNDEKGGKSWTIELRWPTTREADEKAERDKIRKRLGAVDEEKEEKRKM